MLRLLLKVVFFPITIGVSFFETIIKIFTGAINLLDWAFTKATGVAAVLLISAIIVGGFKLWDKVKGPQEEPLASADEETFTSFYDQRQQQK